MSLFVTVRAMQENGVRDSALVGPMVLGAFGAGVVSLSTGLCHMVRCESLTLGATFGLHIQLSYDAFVLRNSDTFLY